MGNIHERRCVGIPFEHASEYLDRYMHDVIWDGAGHLVLSVVVPVERLGFDRRIEISKAVTVRFSPATEDGSADHMTAISWEPEGRGPFPQFNGCIGLQPDQLPEHCQLVLDGEYDPPLGIAGDVFDAIVGKHIARMTIRNLLDEIAISMEMSYASSEQPVAVNPVIIRG